MFSRFILFSKILFLDPGRSNPFLFLPLISTVGFGLYMAQTHISQPILFPSFSFFFARLSLPIDTEPKQLLRCLRTTIAVVLFLSEATQLQPSFGLLGEHKRLHGSAALCGRTYCTCQRPALRRGDIGFRGCNIKLKTIISGCAANAVVVADDKSYGNKQIISVTPRLYDYILDNVREPEVLRQLREETAFMRGSMMQVSPDQAQLLAMLVQIHGAEKCIEVGVYTGYSSLAIALVLPESGKLVACDRDPRCLEVAKKYYEKSNVSHKVDIRYGLAADTLRSLILNGEACSYDFAFVDADKRMYPEYLELLLQLVRVGGLIVFDNVLWHGRVADPEVNDAKTVSIRNFNADLMEDERVSISMVPIGDGMTICRKR